jgi:hypothetical protein
MTAAAMNYLNLYASKRCVGWQGGELCPREVELMHSNELHPGGKLSQDDVKTLLFTAIISLLRETFGVGAKGTRYIMKMQIQFKEMGFKLGPA